MTRKSEKSSGNGSSKKDNKSVSLKDLASHLNLSTTTLSLVLNSSPGSTSIPQETKDRIFEAAEKFNYRPNYFAKSLRAQKSFTIGVIVAELSDGYSAMVVNGLESVLVKENYSFLTASHLHRDDLLEKNPQILMERQVEGIIAIDTPIRFKPILPVVNVSGHEDIPGVTNVILNHKKAAELGIEHLISLGHRNIAIIKGQEFSADTEIRFQTIMDEAKRRGIAIDPELIYQLEGDPFSPQIGYVAGQEFLSSKKKFTALFTFNDISAIGAIRAFRESGLRTPEDISVLGFDDIYYAAYHNPALTTIRQPLFEMGELAAQTLLKKLGKRNDNSRIETLTVEPQLIIRQSTAKVRT